MHLLMRDSVLLPTPAPVTADAVGARLLAELYAVSPPRGRCTCGR